MFHKAKSVTPLKGYKLLVCFSDGTSKEYDMKKHIDNMDVFKAFIKEPTLFASAKVDVGGYGIVWNEDIDIDSEEVWVNGKVVNTAFDDLISFNDATTIWGLNESTLRKAVSYGKLVEGIDVQKYGKQWVITRSAMIREYGNPEKEEPIEEPILKFADPSNDKNNIITFK